MISDSSVFSFQFFLNSADWLRFILVLTYSPSTSLFSSLTKRINDHQWGQWEWNNRELLVVFMFQNFFSSLNCISSIKISWFQTWWRRLDIRFFTKLIQLVVFSQTFHWPKSYVSRGVIRETLRRGPYAVVKRARVGYTTAPFFTPFLDHSSTALWDSRMGDYWFLPE